MTDRRDEHQSEIAARLIRHGEELLRAKRGVTEFSRNAESDKLLNDLDGYPHAFVIACLVDRQMTAEKAWLVPYVLSQRLCGFSFEHLQLLTESQIAHAFRKPTPLHRFPDVMSKCVFLAIRRISDVYGDNAARIWMGKPPSADVVLRFLAFQGFGPKLATMAANILARDFKVEFSDYYSVDVSVDVQLRRVFTRLGLVPERASVEQIVYKARAFNPTFPGLLDFPAWEIGRSWCLPSKPVCSACYMRDVCPTARLNQFAAVVAGA